MPPDDKGQPFVPLDLSFDEPEPSSVSDRLIEESLAQQTRQVLSRLTPREEDILRQRFGIGPARADLEEVGQDFETTRDGSARSRPRRFASCGTIRDQPRAREVPRRGRRRPHQQRRRLQRRRGRSAERRPELRGDAQAHPRPRQRRSPSCAPRDRTPIRRRVASYCQLADLAGAGRAVRVSARGRGFGSRRRRRSAGRLALRLRRAGGRQYRDRLAGRGRDVGRARRPAMHDVLVVWMLQSACWCIPRSSRNRPGRCTAPSSPARCTRRRCPCSAQSSAARRPGRARRRPARSRSRPRSRQRGTAPRGRR